MRKKYKVTSIHEKSIELDFMFRKIKKVIFGSDSFLRREVRFESSILDDNPPSCISRLAAG